MRLLLAALILCPAMGNAAFISGNSVYDDCQNAPFEASRYAIGVLDGARTIESWLGVASAFCIPRHTTEIQAKDVMCRYLASNPQARHLDASSIALNAFYAAWPCPR